MMLDSVLSQPARFMLFTGKGGVGKTSLASATAVFLAARGLRVLLVSTDPASNLDHVLETTLESVPTIVAGIHNLWALNVDPRRAAAAYRERVVAPYRTVLPEEAVAEIEEQLSGACTVEIAAFDQFSRLVTDNTLWADYDHIVFDTAPTGHTLRLLQLPAAWKTYLDATGGDTSCLGPMTGLQGRRKQFSDTLDALSNATLTRVALVARPDTHSIAEAHRTSRELAQLGLENQAFIVNGVLPFTKDACDTANAMFRLQKAALESVPPQLRELACDYVPLSAVPPIGIGALRALLCDAPNEHDLPGAQTGRECFDDSAGNLKALIDAIGTEPGVIMTMGKGGVGKTTVASMIAVELAQQGANVHLTTSDPAAHLDTSLAERFRNLRVSRIDPVAETERYRHEVLRQTGKHLDQEARQLLEEDLRSPCTEEIAVFRAFARIVEEAANAIVVMDTAPTGHTILLLDATGAYHRDVSRNRSSLPDEVKMLLPRLRDKRFTRVLIVTLPEETPVEEAVQLQQDLERAAITPYAWVVNQSLAPLTVKHPVLRVKQGYERRYIHRVHNLISRVTIIPWQEPNGKDATMPLGSIGRHD